MSNPDSDAPSTRDSQAPIFLKARWVLPITSPPIEDGVVAIKSGKIASVSKFSKATLKDSSFVDLGNVVLMPKLVNAHTHLEFSHLESPLGQKGIGFADWLRLVISHRGELLARETDVSSCLESAYEKGISELEQSQTICAGDIVTQNTQSQFHWNRAVKIVAFAELIGFSNERVNNMTSYFQSHCSQDSANFWQPAISPHAPYSCHRKLFVEACKFAEQNKIPLAMHLAESQAELELLSSRTGPLREFLDELQIWDDSAFPIGSKVSDYLQVLAKVPNSLVVHGNYLTNEEIDFVSNNRDTISICFCPRTHDYFEHEPYPLPKLQEAGINVVLGTDSRASNPDLSIWNEARFVAEKHSNIDPFEIIKMCSIGAASALGQTHLGSISSEKSAELCVIDLSENVSTKSASELCEMLLRGNSGSSPRQIV